MDRISVILYNCHRAINKAVTGGFNMKHKAERSARPGIQGLVAWIWELGSGNKRQSPIRQEAHAGEINGEKSSQRAPLYLLFFVD